MEVRPRRRDHARMTLDLTDLELETAARACRALRTKRSRREGCRFRACERGAVVPSRRNLKAARGRSNDSGGEQRSEQT
jgi:hypothetical protein